MKVNSVCNNVKVSVIIPVYNQEKFISGALDSLQSQTLKDAEFIFVNDGSKKSDKSLEIMEERAKSDSRIRIINQKNQGAGTARNNGIKAARGEYIAFLDPDDTLEQQALEKLYNKAKKQDCDLVLFDFNRVKENGDIITRMNLQKRLRWLFEIKDNENFNWRDIKPRVLGGTFPMAWNKFYRTDLIRKNKLHFAKCNLAEDHVFTFGAVLTAKNIGYLGENLYNYVIHDTSAVHTRSDKNLCLFRSIDCVKSLLKKLGLTETLKNEYDGYVIRFVSYHVKQMKNLARFKEICAKKLSPYQNQVLNDRFDANQKLLPIIEGLLRKKI